jgi:tetratricopeptide (TPR) repeat protein
VDDSRTQILPITPEEAAPTSPNPEDTSELPIVEAPRPNRLPRATNLLALGRVQEASVLCREELEDDPVSVEAYALLALAEEQAGNRHLAVELYEKLLALDPTRELEAERLEELRGEVAELDAEAPTPEEKEQQLRRLQPVALIILAAAAVLLIMSVGLLLIVRHRNGVTLAQYQQAMQAGSGDYNYGYYAQAAGFFVQALRLRPQDQNARAWYDASIREATAAGTPASQLPQFYAPNTSPFAPVTVGATGEGNAMPPSLPGPGPDGSYPEPTPNTSGNPWDQTEPSPVVPPDHSSQMINPPTPPPTPPPTSVQTGGTGTAVPPPAPPSEEQPMIKVTVSGHRAPGAAAAARAQDYRRQGDQALAAGNTSAALSAYQQAVTAYQAEETAHPSSAKRRRAPSPPCARRCSYASRSAPHI